ncbi:hypothetical protein VTI74DRAFT_10602 [Chaetomium olivicolor]
MAVTQTAAANTPVLTANPKAPLSGAARSVSENGLLAVVWVCFSVATIFVALRLSVRFRQNRSFLCDDYWIIFAWLTLLTMAILQMEQMQALWYLTYLQAGRVVPDQTTAGKTEQLTRWQFPIIKLFWTVLWSVKASFLTVIFRLVKPFPILRRLWYCVFAFVVLGYIGCWLASALTCSPPGDYFKTGKCNSPRDVWMQKFDVLFSTTVDVTSDLMIMALPIAILPSLQLDVRRKAGLGIAFSLGAVIIAVALVRMTQVTTNSSAGVVDLIGLAIWGAVESATAVVVGTLPPLKALLSRSVKKYSSYGNRSKYYASGRTPHGVSTSAHAGYAPNSVSRTVMVAESIPLDGLHRSTQKDGGIYVQRSYHTTVEFDEASSRDDDEVAIVKSGRAV